MYTAVLHKKKRTPVYIALFHAYVTFFFVFTFLGKGWKKCVPPLFVTELRHWHI